MVRKHYVFHGRVQGVGFRITVYQVASRLGLTGWVRNMDNGMVEIEVQGEIDSIKKFLEIIKNGNRFIKVDELYQKKIEVIYNEYSFTERY